MRVKVIGISQLQRRLEKLHGALIPWQCGHDGRKEWRASRALSACALGLSAKIVRRGSRCIGLSAKIVRRGSRCIELLPSYLEQHGTLASELEGSKIFWPKPSLRGDRW